MLFLTHAGTAQGDPVALLMVLALAAVVAVMAVRKLNLRKQAAAAPAAPAASAVTAAPAAETRKPTAPGSAGKLKIHDVEPKAAAMLMAITADKLGKPLNELRFLSIKEVKK